MFDIENGQTSRQIIENLHTKNLIKAEWPMLILMKIKETKIKTGAYEIPKGSKLVEIFNLVASGEVKETKVTIPEGYRIEQIAQLLESKKLTAYADFVAAAKQYEGQLFPDTYYFALNSPAIEIINKMLEDYTDRVSGLDVAKEDLIIASIVEREAVKDDERALIAGIYRHRLELGMKLQADPTVQYGRDSNTVAKLNTANASIFDFWQSISTRELLTVESSYNTYIIPALPPGPICNPGLKSIEASVNYEKTDYLYFLHKDGQIYPSKTEAEHDQLRASVLGAKIN